MKAHFVTFFSPGTMVAEETTLPIDSWDAAKAQEMAAGIKERYDAVPYAFQFTTRERTENDLDSKVTQRSGMYFINCTVRTLTDVERDNLPSEEILRSNMRCNGYKAVVTTVKGWRWTAPVNENDTVLCS